MTWSGGKDSAFTIYELKRSFDFNIVALLTTITEGYDRISMHGVRRGLLESQAEALEIPLEVVTISRNASNEDYEQKMKEKLVEYRSKGVRDVVFGDIFLEDVRAYREENLAKVGLNGIFPLWKRNTVQLARKFVDIGFKSIVTCVDTEQLSGSFAGRIIDKRFLEELPDGVDPCGENGEFHSFVFDGPIFNKPVEFELGESVLRDERFQYFDILIPENTDRS